MGCHCLLHIPGLIDPKAMCFSLHEVTVVVQLLSWVPLFATPGTAARQAPLSSTFSQTLLKFMSCELVMPSNHLLLCHPLLLLPSVFPSIRVFSNESALHIRWPKYWSFRFSISPCNEYSGLAENWERCMMEYHLCRERSELLTRATT